MTVESIGKLSDGREIYLSVGNLVTNIREFKEMGVPYPYLADTQDVVQARLQGLDLRGTRTSVAPISAKGERNILVRPSPLMNELMASQAVFSHRNNTYPVMTRDVYDVAREMAKAQEGIEPEDRTAIMLSSAKDFNITSSHDEARFLDGKNAEECFRRFVPSGQSRIYVLPNPNSKKDSFVNYVWFGYPRSDSDFNCGSRILDIDGNAFGVSK